jgi:N-acetylmuramoyl-L-alanine amidase
VLGCAMVQVLPARATRRHVELTPWEQAERGLEKLDAIPEGTRTRVDYAKAMDGFRGVYHEAPGNVHAPDSVNAVAELLAEQGRRLHDAKSLKAAVGQYEFLRTQYPGSSLRVGALMAEAQIYENDLHDAVAARERYSLLVKEYPRSSLAEEARAGIASLDQGSGHTQGLDLGAARRDEVSPVGSQGSAASSAFVPMPVTRDESAVAVPRGSGVSIASAGGSGAKVATVSPDGGAERQ